MDKRSKIETLLDNKNYLRGFLFRRGFLVTTQEQTQADYPFYNLWKHHTIDKLHVYVHPEQTFFRFQSDDTICFLFGHAYDPFVMEIDEERILQRMAETDEAGRIDILNHITGVYVAGWVDNEKLTLVTDCAGMQCAYYGEVNGHFYMSSHMQLVGDILSLKQSIYVRELTSYRFYRYYGAYLPGDLSAYDELKRLVPNVLMTYAQNKTSVTRFYPARPLTMRTTKQAYQEGIEVIGKILSNNLKLIAKKWNKPAISMTGGMDSKATLAAANGVYDQYAYFSYISIPGEKIDADAAHKIAETIGVEHKIDCISDDNNVFPDYAEIACLLEHNFGNIGAINENDARKRAYYAQDANRGFDIEVKSWVSEIGRANYYKKFGFQRMPKRLTPRQMTSMYKLFVHNRKLVRQTDAVFSDYIQKYDFNNIYNYDASDMFLWEIRYGSWGGQVITCEHKYSFDITIPYNNRLLMETFLTLPLEKRISDQVHYDLIRYLNPAIDETGITITNYNETRTRMYKEKIYFLVQTHIPI